MTYKVGVLTGCKAHRVIRITVGFVEMVSKLCLFISLLDTLFLTNRGISKKFC